MIASGSFTRNLNVIGPMPDAGPGVSIGLVCRGRLASGVLCREWDQEIPGSSKRLPGAMDPFLDLRVQNLRTNSLSLTDAMFR